MIVNKRLQKMTMALCITASYQPAFHTAFSALQCKNAAICCTDVYFWFTTVSIMINCDSCTALYQDGSVSQMPNASPLFKRLPPISDVAFYHIYKQAFVYRGKRITISLPASKCAKRQFCILVDPAMRQSFFARHDGGEAVLSFFQGKMAQLVARRDVLQLWLYPDLQKIHFLFTNVVFFVAQARCPRS